MVQAKKAGAVSAADARPRRRALGMTEYPGRGPSAVQAGQPKADAPDAAAGACLGNDEREADATPTSDVILRRLACRIQPR